MSSNYTYIIRHKELQENTKPTNNLRSTYYQASRILTKWFREGKILPIEFSSLRLRIKKELHELDRKLTT